MVAGLDGYAGGIAAVAGGLKFLGAGSGGASACSPELDFHWGEEWRTIGKLTIPKSGCTKINREGVWRVEEECRRVGVDKLRSRKFVGVELCPGRPGGVHLGHDL